MSAPANVEVKLWRHALWLGVSDFEASLAGRQVSPSLLTLHSIGTIGGVLAMPLMQRYVISLFPGCLLLSGDGKY